MPFDRIKILDLPTDCDAYRASLHHVDENNVITHLFNYHDLKAQGDFMLQQYNKRHLQKVLFLSEEY